MGRGVVEASALRDAFQQLENNGPVETVEQVLQWPVLASAVKEGVVSRLLCSVQQQHTLLSPGSCGLR